MKRWIGVGSTLVVWLALTPAAGSDVPLDACGMSPSDWCSSPPGDRCGIHKDATACKADPQCYGMPYRGELVVACLFDERGFASNCPTVGCTSVPPKKPGEQ